MKSLVLLVAILVITAVAFSNYVGIALAANRSEGAIPQTGDLCGGTGGNGQIVNVANNEFTIKRNDDGSNQLIHLTNQATIKTLTGSVSLSKLKKGDRVTLVGGPNKDGSFTADKVVLCSGDQENRAGRAASLTIRKENTNYKKVNTVINIATIFFITSLWFAIALFLRLKRKKSLVYMLFFTIFYVYLYKVLDYTLLQFQSLLLLKQFVPHLLLNGISAGKNINLIPIVTLKLEDVRTSLLNILLMMPFGFGLPFIVHFRMKKVVIAGFLLSLTIEFLQFITGYMAHITFRIADVNDLLFNTVGAAIGYMLFIGFMQTYRQLFHRSKVSPNPILRYIAELPQGNGN